ncbi:MAG: TolC family protein, partial [Odoribacter sp.]|nr:TolC family protein [Odoribacter sp.]
MKVLILTFFCLTSQFLYAQLEDNTQIKYREKLALDEVITLATQRSIDANKYKYQFLTAYWQFRAFKAELLPSLNLNLTAPNFSHSISTVQNYETGEYNYVQNYYMQNSTSLSINQNIAATGGTLALSSTLERLDQFQPRRYHRYTSNPLSLIYVQPIFGNFNSLKWSKIIEPESYEKAKLNYLENMESIRL